MFEIYTKNQHGVDGMVGCFDCMHVQWDNCPLPLCGIHVKMEYQHWF